METHKKAFFSLLQSHFYGTKLSGKTGKTKMLMYKWQFFEAIKKQIEGKIETYKDQKEGFYNILYTFFSKYLNETGTPFLNTTKSKKELVFINNSREDVKLFYKTDGLYYVKSERIFSKEGQTVEFEFEGKNYEIHFDESEVKEKSTNVKDTLVFEKVSVDTLKVKYKADLGLFGNENIVKEKEESLFAEAIKHYKRQAECDFFIHSNAKKFLTDSFKVFLLNQVYSESEFSREFIDHMQAIKETGEVIINYIASFEDELKKMWLKPKFAKNVNYCITLSSLNENIKKEVLENLPEEQLEEWKNLGMVTEGFDPLNISDLIGDKAEYKHLPIDTKYFDEETKYSILSSFESLEESINGALVKSDNFQALNTLKKNYAGKVKLIYIDPPYNTQSDDFIYRDGFKRASWLCMIKNRLELAKEFLTEDGVIFVQIDDNEQAHLKVLMDEVFGAENFVGNIIWLKNNAQNDAQSLQKNHEYITVFQNRDMGIYRMEETRKVEAFKENGKYYYEASGMSMGGGEGGTLAGRPNLGFTIYYNPDTKDFIGFDDINKTLAKTSHNEAEVYTDNQALLNQGYKIIRPPKNGIKLGCWKWSIEKFNAEKDKILIKKTRTGYSVARREWIEEESVIENEGRFFLNKEINNYHKSVIENISANSGTLENKALFGGDKTFSNPKSEKLIERIMQISSQEDDLIMDFFLGSGTTAAVAQKMNRKWLGIEMGDHFEDVTLFRQKKVLAGEQGGVSKSNHWQGGGIFKYYELESYEETLETSHYCFDENKELEHITKLKDIKNTGLVGNLDLKKSEYLLELGLDLSTNEPLLTLEELYDGEIDIIETIANAKGYTIEKIYSKTQVKFKELEEITDLETMDLNEFKFLLPYLFLA